MKAPGFVEEQEWRLIFMPPAGVSPMLNFHPRRDFLAPYLTLNNIWFTLQPAMIAIPALAALLNPIRATAHVRPLVPITQIMVGPSGHATLTQRAMQKLVAQVHRGAIPITISAIPYRSLA
jgi:hypothetical protein